MNMRNPLLFFMLALACHACATAAPSDLQEKVIADSAARSEIRASSGGLPSLELKKTTGEASQLRDEALPDGWRLLQGGGGKLIDPRARVVIRGSGDAPIVSVELSPDRKRYLVDRGSGRYSIHDLEGALVRDVPGFEIPDASAITWRWKNDSSLVGITEISPDEGLPQYPESDVLPSATLLLLYRLDGGGALEVLYPPRPPRGTVVRLDGVTSEGALALSAVVPEEYFGGASEQQLGFYDLE